MPEPDGITTTRSAPVLRARGVSKAFNGVPALVDFDIEIEPGQVHALVGGNGSGKSTFIKILSGFHRADAGVIEMAGKAVHAERRGTAHALGCHFVHQDLGLVGSLSTAENLYLGSTFPTRLLTLRKRQIRKEAQGLFDFVGLNVPPARKVESLSRSQMTLVAVARSMRNDPDRPIRLLVLDEPTATLPADDVAHLTDLIRRVAAQGIGVLYVSHRLGEVTSLADVVTVLRDGRKQALSPVKDLTRADLVNLVVGSTFYEQQRYEHAAPAEGAKTRLAVSDLHTHTVHGVSFHALEGEIVGLAGITGSGRETILRSVFSGERSDRGTVIVDGQSLRRGNPRYSVGHGLVYLPPDRKILAGYMDLSARQNIVISDLSKFWSGGRMRRQPEIRESKQWFEDLQVSPRDGIEHKLGIFSGGNQQKIIFARWLRRDPIVLLVDEPTQGVDVAAKAQLHDRMRAAAAGGAAVVISSSDDDELAAVCDRVLVMRDGLIASEIKGSHLTAPVISAECVRVTEPSYEGTRGWQ